ncbi:methylglyoxal synthase [soil metagenome]
MTTIALIAHDGKKEEMTAFAASQKEGLAACRLIGTGTTARIVSEATGLWVEGFLSGPLGGDVQIAAEVLAGRVAVVLFFVEPRDVHPHDPDILTLQRICNLTDTPLATNPASALLLLRGLW